MTERKNSSGRQQGAMNQGSQWQQSQQIDRDDRQHGGSRKQLKTNRTHRSQQR